MRPGEAVYEFQGPLEEARVASRPNRFLVVLEGGRACHIHDPGRLPELIYPGNRVLVRPTRGARTSCSVTAAWGGSGWVVTDSRIHSDVAARFLPPGARREVRVGSSRLDFAFDDTYVEVKGCTLVINGVALFPDAPTERGRRHVEELARLRREGHGAALMVLVMRDDARCFAPNETTDPAFTRAFREALRVGVDVWVRSFRLTGNQVIYVGDLPLCLETLGGAERG